MGQQQTELQDESGQERQRPLEQVQIIGSRLNLRTQMLEAERKAYDTFNKYNDEKRFSIRCTMHAPTGSNIKKQICQAEFERDATRAHAQAYHLTNYIGMNTAAMPVEAVIAANLEDFKRKQQQIAQEHPEFLEAIKDYIELKEQFQGEGRQASRNTGALESAGD